MQKLNAGEAFKAMYFFLEDYYEQQYLGYLGGILGELNILEDGTTADTAAGLEWLECLEEATNQPLTATMRKNITIDAAYDAMYRLILRFSEQMLNPKELTMFLNDLEKYKREGINSEIGRKWLDAINESKTNDYPLNVNNFKRYSK